MATATETKPKAARTIVTTRITTSGVKAVLAKSALDQLERAMELCGTLEHVPQFAEQAKAAREALDVLVVKAS